MSPPRTAAILLAAGASERMGGLDKSVAPLDGQPVASYSLRAFAACDGVSSIVLVCGDNNRAALETLAAAHGGGKVTAIVPGGPRRQDSVARGLAALADADLVAVHDTARPLVTSSMIARGIDCAARHGAAIAAAPLTDTIKEVNGDSPDGAVQVTRTIDRRTLRAAQTPQLFRRDLLLRAHAAAGSPAVANGAFTDDAALVEALGHRVVAYDPGAPNPKITTPADLPVVAALLRARAQTPLAQSFSSQPTPASGEGGRESGAQDRVGIGTDIHRFDPQRPLILGGVRIPDSPGLAGHSDADALSHAIIDALLGAAALGDIGQHFPPDDAQWAGVDSQDLLARAVAMLVQHGYRVGNVDATVIAEQPKLQPHIPAMRGRLAASMGVDVAVVSVKATTAEGLGPVGRSESLQAQAIVRILADAPTAASRPATRP